MATSIKPDDRFRRIGGETPLMLVVDGRTASPDDRSNVAAFINDVCIHKDPSKCDDPLIRALYAFAAVDLDNRVIA